MSRALRTMKQAFARALMLRVQSNETPMYLMASSVGVESTESDSVRSSERDTHSGALFGKRIQRDEVSLLIKKYEWVAGSVYSEYDDLDPNLPDRRFYVAVKDGSIARVYKCLSNNNGAASTSNPYTPSTAVFGPFDTPEGYRWVYMYETTADDSLKFESDTHLPVRNSALASAAAVGGAVDHVKILNGGSGYSWGRGIIRTTTDSRKFELILDDDLSQNQSRLGLHFTPGYYSRCAIKLQMSAGVHIETSIQQIPALNLAGTILGHVREGGRVYVYFSTPMEGVIGDSRFEISPYVEFNAYDRTTNDQTASAFAAVNEGNGALRRVDVIRSGSGYNEAEVTIVGAPGYGGNARVRAIVSPPNGHGHDSEKELYAKDLGVHSSMQLSEGFPANTQYSRLSLVSGIEPISSTAISVNQRFDYRVVLAPGDYTAARSALLSNTQVNVLTGNTDLFSNTSVLAVQSMSDDVNNALFIATSSDVERNEDPSEFEELRVGSSSWPVVDASGQQGRSTANTEWQVGRDVSLLRFTVNNNSVVAGDGKIKSVLTGADGRLESISIEGLSVPTSNSVYYVGVTDDGDSNPSVWKYLARVEQFENSTSSIDFVDRLWEVRLNTNSLVTGDIVVSTVTDRRMKVVRSEADRVLLAGMDDENGTVLLVGPSSIGSAESLRRLSDQSNYSIVELVSTPNAKYGTGDVLYINNVSPPSTVNRDRLKLTIIT